MTKIITEVIQALDLFAGGVDDVFEIEPGGMPNGDECLVVRGDISQNGRAYDNVAGVTSPDIVSPTFVNAPGTIVLWLKLGSLGGSDLGTANTRNSILTVQNETSVVQNAIQETSVSVTGSWKICAGGIDGLTVVFGTSWKSSGGTKQYRGTSQVLTVDTWHMMAISNVTGATSGIRSSLDGGPYINPAGSSRSTSSSASSASELAIGSRSTATGVGLRPGVWRIGKVSFHAGLLTQPQLVDLYDSMMYGSIA